MAMPFQSFSVLGNQIVVRRRDCALYVLVLIVACCPETGCKITPRPGAFEPRRGDEVMVAGQLFHTGTKVLLWIDPGGYDAYRVERRFAPLDRADWEHSQEDQKELRSPNRYNMRKSGLSEEAI